MARLEEWRRSGGSQEDARLTRQSVGGVVGSLLGAAILAVSTTAIVLKLKRGSGL